MIKEILSEGRKASKIINKTLKALDGFSTPGGFSVISVITERTIRNACKEPDLTSARSILDAMKSGILSSLEESGWK